MTKKNSNKIKKEVGELLKAVKKKSKKLNCVATEKCQINFEQQ